MDGIFLFYGFPEEMTDPTSALSNYTQRTEMLVSGVVSYLYPYKLNSRNKKIVLERALEDRGRCRQSNLITLKVLNCEKD